MTRSRFDIGLLTNRRKIAAVRGIVNSARVFQIPLASAHDAAILIGEHPTHKDALTMKREEPKSLAELATRTRYPIDAFHFVRRGLDYTVHRTHKNPDKLPD